MKWTVWQAIRALSNACHHTLISKPSGLLCDAGSMLGHQVRDPHDSNNAPVVERLLLCVLVAGPTEVLLCSEGLTFLIDPHLAFEDMAHHRIRHRRTSG